MNPLSPEKKVAVLGNGETARRLSEELLERGFPVMLVMPNEKNTNEVPEGAEYVAGEELVSVKGQVSDFTLVLRVVGKREERRVGFIVIAYESVREPVYDILGEPHHNRIWPLSYLEQLDDDAFGEKYGKIIPIMSSVRHALLLSISAQFGIYSLGRFATWRNILLDDVIHDAQRIEDGRSLSDRRPGSERLFQGPRTRAAGQCPL